MSRFYIFTFIHQTIYFLHRYRQSDGSLCIVAVQVVGTTLFCNVFELIVVYRALEIKLRYVFLIVFLLLSITSNHATLPPAKGVKELQLELLNSTISYVEKAIHSGQPQTPRHPSDGFWRGLNYSCSNSWRC